MLALYAMPVVMYPAASDTQAQVHLAKTFVAAVGIPFSLLWATAAFVIMGAIELWIAGRIWKA